MSGKEKGGLLRFLFGSKTMEPNPSDLFGGAEKLLAAHGRHVRRRSMS